MTTLVLDAGVAAKWFLPAAGEELVKEAFHLLRQYDLGNIEFFVPDLFWAEFGNLAWNAARRKRWSPVDATKAVHRMRSRNLPTMSCLTLLQPAFEIAMSFDRTVYDSIYVALAVHLGVDLITADERLANSLPSRYPVRWLGAFSVA